MERIRRKLHSRRGASILLALFLTLVVSMICAVIISASVTSARRVRSDRGQQQITLSTGSGARVAADSLSKARFTYTKTVTTTEEYWNAGTADNPDWKSSSSSSTSEDKACDADSPLSDWLLQKLVFNTIHNESLTDPVSVLTGDPYYITVVPQEEHLSPAVMKFTLERVNDNRYLIRGTVYDVEGDKSGGGDYVIKTAAASLAETDLQPSAASQTQLSFSGELRREYNPDSLGPYYSTESDETESASITVTTSKTVEIWYVANVQLSTAR